MGSDWEKRLLCHYRNFKNYVSYGIEVSKLKKVIWFKWEPWMKIYIEDNNEWWDESTTEICNFRFKNLKIILYGKAMESIRNGQRVAL